jgi:hypothetical protein
LYCLIAGWKSGQMFWGSLFEVMCSGCPVPSSVLISLSPLSPSLTSHIAHPTSHIRTSIIGIRATIIGIRRYPRSGEFIFTARSAKFSLLVVYQKTHPKNPRHTVAGNIYYRIPHPQIFTSSNPHIPKSLIFKLSHFQIFKFPNSRIITLSH